MYWWQRSWLAQPLPAPILRIRPSDTGADAELYWDPVTGADKYQVFLSSMPYFIPGDGQFPSAR